MSIRYHHHTTLAAAERICAALRADGRTAYVLSMRADFHEVREIVASPLDAAGLVPRGSEPCADGSRVTIDFRN